MQFSFRFVWKDLTCHSMYCVQAAAPVLWILTQKVKLLVFHIAAHRFAIKTIINKLIIFNWCDTFCNHISKNTSKFNSMCLVVPTGGIGCAIQAQMTPFTRTHNTLQRRTGLCLLCSAYQIDVTSTFILLLFSVIQIVPAECPQDPGLLVSAWASGLSLVHF